MHGGKALGELGAVHPVGRCAAPVQHPGRGEQECAGADRGDATRLGPSLPHPFDQELYVIPQNTHLHIGSLLFEGIDQIDLTGPFEVLSRIPNSTYRIYGKTTAPVRDLKGLWLTPDAAVADAPPLDVLHP
jgi:hypothetical protein